MKKRIVRKKAIGILLISAGAFLVVLAPLTRWVTVPAMARIPDGIDIESSFDGKAVFHVEPDTRRVLENGETVEIPLVINASMKSLPEKSTFDVVVFETRVSLTAPDAVTYEKYRAFYDKMEYPVEYYAIDRRTGRNVRGHNSDVNRSGHFQILGIGVEKKTYGMWDGGIQGTIDHRFIGEEQLDGATRKDVRVYVFGVESGLLDLTSPPAGFPSEVPVNDENTIIAQSGGVPALPDGIEGELPLSYLKRVRSIIRVEPRTGIIVDTEKHHEEYLIDMEKLGITPNLTIFEIEYETSDEMAAKAVDNAAGYFWKLDLGLIWAPLLFLSAGVLILAPGILMVAGRRKNKDSGSAPAG
ncbi:MAG: DUF3068 domain-containing protein [Actinobacteria bacterium]|nr:DUF3068 domain-containing protein [Actinomycetota bacterium]